MRSKVHHRHARSSAQRTAVRWGWSLASALGSVLHGGCTAVCNQIVRAAGAMDQAVGSSPHAVAAVVLNSSGVLVDLCGVPGLGPLWNLGVDATTAGLAAHAVVTVAQQYGLDESSYVPVLTSTVRRMRSVTGSVPMSGTVLELYCELAAPDGTPEVPATSILLQSALGLLNGRTHRWMGNTLPVVATALRWLNAGTKAMQSATYVTAMQAQAHHVCEAMTAEGAVRPSPRQAPRSSTSSSTSTEVWPAPLAA